MTPARKSKRKRSFTVTEAIATGTISNEIRRMRDIKGWSQADLAKASGVTEKLIQRYETDPYIEHDVGIVARIADAAGFEFHLRLCPRGLGHFIESPAPARRGKGK